MAKAKKNEEALAVAEETAMEMYDYGEDAGAGDEDQTSADLIIPFITILQTNSPQVDPGDEKYVEGARPGLFLNTVTGHVYETVKAVAVATERAFMEWVPRDSGGGLVGKRKPTDPVVEHAVGASEKFGKYYVGGKEGGNELVETFYVYWLLADGDDAGLPALSAFTSTKIQPYKRWNTSRSLFRLKGGQKPPIFAHLVELSTVKQKNEKGSYYTIKIEPANGSVANSLLNPKDEIMRSAKDLRENVKAGAVKVDYESENSSAGSASDDDEDLHF